MTLNDIKIEGIDYNQLTGINIIETAHSHGICELSFILPWDFDAEKIFQWNKKKITVKAKKDIIFCGIISHCKVTENVGEKILLLKVLSLSCQMESARKSKTYQSPDKKLSDVVKDVIGTYESAEADFWKDDKISEIIYRDNLTDWEFLKEIAERHGQVLFVNSKTDRLSLSVGFKAFDKFDEDISMELLSRGVPLDFYRRLAQNTYEGARTCYFSETNILTSELKIGVGSEVTYENITQAVIESRIYDDGDFLRNELKLRPAEGCRAEAWDVMKHFDEFYCLTGKVLEAKENNLKIHFDCDEKQNKDEALNIPYESAANNYLYTMPDETDKVYVYIDRIRQAAMISLRSKGVEDESENRSFKSQNMAIIFDTKKFSFTAADKTEMKQEDGVSFSTDKNIIFSSKGDMIIQAAQGLVPDNQLTMAAPHFAGYAQYLAALGQPATVQFNPAGSTVGKIDSQIKNAGSKKEAVELSDLAKELDKITGRKDKKDSESSSGNSSGGSLKLDGKKSSLIQVKDSSFGMEGSNLNVKTCALIQVAYVPLAGGGTGSLSKFEGGNPGNRSDKINLEHGIEDRARIKENVEPTPDYKTISV